MLTLENVWKIFRIGAEEVHALREVYLDIDEGEFIVVLGPSGSGKTTLLNIIGGIDVPNKGKVVFKGTDVTQLDEEGLTYHRRENIGFVFQFFNLIPTLTARENVQLASELVEKPRDADEVLETVGLKERADHFPSELSGGEQQRVSIARALVKNPPLILADEPTGNLDFETGKKVLKYMREVCHNERITFTIVTHNSAIAQMADRIVRLKDGTIDNIVENEQPLDPEKLYW
ncbi:MAG: ABC transporter ATP-binding protein [Candidatus Hadarchaeota archaeon]